jgi:hypothetical protein
VTRQKWSIFENDQLRGQTWSNLVKPGQRWSKMVKDGQQKMVKKHGRKTWSKHSQKKSSLSVACRKIGPMKFGWLAAVPQGFLTKIFTYQGAHDECWHFYSVWLAEKLVP